MINANVHTTNKLFPIDLGDMAIRLVEISDLDRYCNILMSKEFNKYLINPFNKCFKLQDLKDIIRKRVLSYHLEAYDIGEYRVLLTQKATNEILGCCTIYFSEDNMEISYYVLPVHRKKGLAFKMITEIL